MAKLKKFNVKWTPDNDRWDGVLDINGAEFTLSVYSDTAEVNCNGRIIGSYVHGIRKNKKGTPPTDKQVSKMLQLVLELLKEEELYRAQKLNQIAAENYTAAVLAELL